MFNNLKVKKLRKYPTNAQKYSNRRMGHFTKCSKLREMAKNKKNVRKSKKWQKI